MQWKIAWIARGFINFSDVLASYEMQTSFIQFLFFARLHVAVWFRNIHNVSLLQKLNYEWRIFPRDCFKVSCISCVQI